MMSRGLLIALCALALVGCDPRDAESSRITADENALIDRLTRDPFIVVIDRRRNEDGYLVVSTQQGNTRVRYLFAPDSPASKELKIRRIVEDFTMKVGTSDGLGTGPEPRGLER